MGYEDDEGIKEGQETNKEETLDKQRMKKGWRREKEVKKKNYQKISPRWTSKEILLTESTGQKFLERKNFRNFFRNFFVPT
jgi:hypothetical protein